MRLNNIARFNSINEYIADKINRFSKEEKNFKNLFLYMFSERENVMAESSDGYRIKKVTYGECYDMILRVITVLRKKLRGIEKGAFVGLYSNNRLEWLQIFWAILACGYNPLLLNSHTGEEVLINTVNDYGVKAIISEDKQFSVQTIFLKEIYDDLTIERDSLQEEWGKEVYFMSSGTSEKVKLCSYTAENFYYQLCDSQEIIKNCSGIKKHYKGQLKLLTLLPFYHVFGFIAVYLWFGFFSRTFVFLKDMYPQTLLNTVRKHKVTHIFAVPLVWEVIYKEAVRKIRVRGEKTLKNFKKALSLTCKCEILGNIISKFAFKEIRDNIFGESICFLISGGSGISEDVLRFFNGIGYHMANGYGMTEIGIASVETSMKKRIRNKGSVGVPFKNTEYSLSSNGELLVRGKTMACRIISGNTESVTDYTKWFATRDLAQEKKGRYYVNGRADDLIVCSNGENVNPEIIERSLKIKHADEICLFAGEQGEPTLIISARGCFSPETLKSIYSDALSSLQSARVHDEVKKVIITTDKLISDDDFKVSRKKIAKRLQNGEFTVINPAKIEEYSQELFSSLEKEIRSCFAEVLQKEESEITLDGDFFLDFGGSSLEYFALIELIKERFDVDVIALQQANKTTVREFCAYVSNV
ncbi:MAG: non-ribosomal peptide synthetase [Clostridia bacterium]|nr:non-ribosomal peptide synthetase [Clostridia bacterium]